jgi:hypothetical protein
MTTILVVVSFLAGASWGPVVNMTSTSGPEACGALKWEVARQIADVSLTNVTGRASITKQEDELLVVAGAQGTREVARTSCQQG